MALIICPECGKEYSNRAKNCPNCGCPTEENDSDVNVCTQENDLTTYEKLPRGKVVEHLRMAKELEESIYTYQKSVEKIQILIDQLGHKQNIVQPNYIMFSNTAWFILSITIIICLAISIESFKVALLQIGNKSTYFFRGVLLLVPVFIILIIIMFKINHKKQIKKQHLDNIRKDTERVIKENKQKSILKKQQDEIIKKEQECENILKNFYDLDVIYPKYRNMVAVITILEYFESGKCSKMTGPHGAYQIYDYEALMKKIICSLDVIITQLEQVKQTQYMLYEAIQEANYNAECIYENSREILKSSNETAKNAALIAYNSERVRRNTEISAYIDLFD